MKTSNPSTYVRTQVLTASQGELRLMLLDGAIRFAEQARAALVKRDFETVYNGLTRCQAILMELISALKPEHAPELCNRLSGLYTFMYTRLVDAGHKKDPALVDEVLDLLCFERQTWSMLLEQLAQENRSAGELGDTPRAAPLVPQNESPARDLVGGSVSVRA